MTKVFRELDSVRLAKSLYERVFGEDRDVEVAAGSIGLVVHVFGDAESPSAYIVEFKLSSTRYVVANVVPDDLREFTE